MRRFLAGAGVRFFTHAASATEAQLPQWLEELLIGWGGVGRPSLGMPRPKGIERLEFGIVRSQAPASFRSRSMALSHRWEVDLDHCSTKLTSLFRRLAPRRAEAMRRPLALPSGAGPRAPALRSSGWSCQCDGPSGLVVRCVAGLIDGPHTRAAPRPGLSPRSPEPSAEHGPGRRLVRSRVGDGTPIPSCSTCSMVRDATGLITTPICPIGGDTCSPRTRL